MAKSKAAETPLMKQYNAIKAKHPGTVLLFRVGDFYETFGQDAITVSGILGIVLTKRANGAASHIELAGFPHHSLDTYLPKLVRAGQRVAVCDQLEDPKQAKGIVKRGVTELVTPGVALSDKILESKQNNFLAAVYFEGPGLIGASFADVSTGDFFCLSGEKKYVEKVINSFAPAEVLVPRKDIRKFAEEMGEKHYVTRVEDWVFQFDFGKETLLKHFKTTSLKGFGIDKDEAGTVAAGAILHYLGETAQTDLGHISKIYRFEDSEFVWLDAFTIRNLELVHPLHPDGHTLTDVVDKTLTPMGARLLRRWVLFPLKDLQTIRRRQDIVEAMLKDEVSSEGLKEVFKKVGDMERMVSKLATQKIQPTETVQLRNALSLLDPIKEVLRGFGSKAVNKRIKEFEDVSEAHKMLMYYLGDEVSNKILTGGVIREGVNAELDELRGIKQNGKDLLVAMQQREAERTGIPKLKIGFNKVFGYYIEISRIHTAKAPEDFIRKQTLTNAERYITPELKEYEEKILGAEERIGALETDLYFELLNKLQYHIGAIQRNAILIGEFDVYQSFAQTAKDRNYAKPELHTGDEIDIRAGRHPVIETTLPRDEPYIPNDVFLDNKQQQVIIITGPNMAGKSALLRQTALITLLAQMGSYVPADSAKIGLVDKVFTRVGASDNISTGESTFMVEMNEAARILNNCTRKSLILLDEIGRGTSTYDGVSIAWALVEYLHETKSASAKTLFATHYHELNEITNRMSRVKNYNVAVKEHKGKVIFIRKLLPGGSEHSFGIHVAEMAGMPRKIVKRANELLVHFEKNRMDDKEKAQNVKFVEDPTFQLNMFELKDTDTLKIRQVLAGCDIDRMTPVEALLKLQEIKLALID